MQELWQLLFLLLLSQQKGLLFKVHHAFERYLVKHQTSLRDLSTPFKKLQNLLDNYKRHKGLNLRAELVKTDHLHI